MTDVKVSQSMEVAPSRKFRCLLLTTSGLSFLLTLNKSFLSWISDWVRWCPTSVQLLQEAEGKLFSYLKKPYEVSFVPIKTENQSECEIRSITSCKDNETKITPLVMLHGFASGIGLWVLNIDSLSLDRTVHAPDILGFGLSSRPTFSRDAEQAENQLVESIEQWRKKLGLKKFILLGHSMGGFLAAAYSIKYPDNVKHLILADPWGFPTTDLSERKVQIPVWAKAIASVLRPFNPLAALRIAGPWGPQLVTRLRPDILRKFDSVVTDLSDVSNYIYHCNAQCPSGEAAFKAMAAPFGWAKRPMLQRISQLRDDISISFIYGSKSWIDSSSGLHTSSLRENSFVEIKMIEGAGHHVYADKASEFNSIVSNICTNADQGVTMPTGEQFLTVQSNNPVETTEEKTRPESFISAEVSDTATVSSIN